MGVKITGIKEIQKKLDGLGKKAENLNNSEVRFDKLFNESFMVKYTECKTIDDFFRSGDFILSSEEDFNKISEESLDKLVKSKTKFSSWDEMKLKAADIYISKELGF